MENIDELVEKLLDIEEFHSHKTREKIERLIAIKLRERSSNSFNEIYDYLVDLIEKFKIPYQEKNALRLDSKIKFDSKKEFHEVIGSMPEELNLDEDNKNLLTFDEISGNLEQKLGSIEFDILKKIIDKKGINKMNLISPLILNQTYDIKEKFEEFIKKEYPLDYFNLYRDKYSGLGRKDILKLDPAFYFSLKRFGLLDSIIPKRKRPIENGFRKFKSPLEYFLANKETYSWMNRSSLSKCDLWLYESLKKWKQLDQAIPPKPGKKQVDINYKGHTNPLAYFLANKENYLGLDREALFNFDRGLYFALERYHQLDKAIPPKPGKKWLIKWFDEMQEKKGLRGCKFYRGCISPLDYFLKNTPKYNHMNRTKLSLKDPGLYRSLKRYGQLDQAIPLTFKNKYKAKSL